MKEIQLKYVQLDLVDLVYKIHYLQLEGFTLTPYNEDNKTGVNVQESKTVFYTHEKEVRVCLMPNGKIGLKHVAYL